MAACNLSIELADGDRIYRAGERLRGTVVVQTTDNVSCRGLEVATGWATHGRGNVAAADVEKQVLFQGDWTAGSTYRYDFDLLTGSWPPTYHGEYLNVDHLVRATAKLPWKWDPKVTRPFRLFTTDAPESGAPPASEANQASGKIVSGVLGIVLLVVAIVFLLNPFLWCLGLVAALGGGIWWFFRKWLPTRKLGQVRFALQTPRVCPADSLRGQLTFTPPQRVTLNGIEVTVTAKEICVSGSGSSRTTHNTTVFEQRLLVCGPGELAGGQQHQFPIVARLPNKPIYTMDLNDNDLVWSAAMRIDIPRWPDWLQEEKFSVIPPSDPAVAAALLAGDYTQSFGEAWDLAVPDVATSQPASHETVFVAERIPSPNAEAGPASVAAPADAGISFAETVRLLWASRDQPETASRLVEAVKGLPIVAAVRIDRRLLYTDSSDRLYVGDRGVVFAARFADPPLRIKLYLPDRSFAEIADVEREAHWSGRATIVGFDADERMLQIQAV